MTRMCTRLVTRGLVVRVPSAIDRREVVITLSTTGNSVVDDVLSNRRAANLTQSCSGSPNDDRDTIISALNTFAAAADDEDASGNKGDLAIGRAFITPEETS